MKKLIALLLLVPIIAFGAATQGINNGYLQSDFYTNGFFVGNVQTVGDTNAAILAATDTIRLTTALTASRVLTLPSASSFKYNRVLRILDPTGAASSTHTVSIARNGSDTMNGGTSNVVALAAPYLSAVITSDGLSKWSITPLTAGGGGTATNLAGGSGGTIPYQTAANTTAMLANGSANQVLQSNGTTLAPSWVTLAGGGNALTSNPLSQFASTTSAQLSGVLSDDTGGASGGLAVFNNGPTLIGPILGTPASGVMTNVTGIAANLTAGHVTTNANSTGDVTSVGNATTLATVATAGTTGSSTAIPVVTINAKGLTTGITTAAVVAPAGTLSGATLASGVTASSLTSFGTGIALGTPASGVATNLTGTAASLTAGNVTTNANLTGDVTSSGNATTLTNAPVIAKVLTGYTSGVGTISAADSILQAIQKLNGNAALFAPLASPTFTGVPAAPTAAVDTNTTQLSTTAFVLAQAASATPIIDGTGAVGTSTRYARADHVHPSDTTKANLSGGNTFTGTQTMAGPVNSTNGILGAGSPGGTGGTSYGSNAPITLYVKSVTVLTSATPADIATITIPAGITRWMLTSAAN